MSAIAKLTVFALDCPDPHGLAEFYMGITGWEIDHVSDEGRWVELRSDVGATLREATGTDCTASQKRTSGGGVLRSDILEQQDENRSEVYTAATAFNGKYKVTVASALGRAIGNKATLKVTKFAGTDKEEVEVYTVDLAKPAHTTYDLELVASLTDR